ncbi:hypothetical protein OTU49_015665 [Cherax quadricarinatus]|nr:uncharacterized protein KIAA1143 homolog isoform X2 [Cherax quadricarinatus]
MAGWTGKRANVSYSKPEEPAFLKRFKEQVGYKEDRGLSDKFAVMPPATDDDLDDKEDELPQVVSLHADDLTQEEYEKLHAEGKLSELLKGTHEEVQGPKQRDEEPPADGRILFRKPTKRSGEDKKGRLDPKKLKREEKDEKPEKKYKDKRKELQKQKLLSFNEDEEDEED